MGINVFIPSFPPSKKTRTRHLSEIEPALVNAERLDDSAITLIGIPDKYSGTVPNGIDFLIKSLLFILA